MSNEFLEKRKELALEEVNYLRKKEEELIFEKHKINNKIAKLKREKDALETEYKITEKRLSDLSTEVYLYAYSKEDKIDLNGDVKTRFGFSE